MRERCLRICTVVFFLVIVASSAGPSGPAPLGAADIEKDPQGFNGIPWGTPLAGRSDFTLVASAEPIMEYELAKGPPPLGEARVDSMRFSTIDGRFARVTIRYRGQATHDRVMAYLQATFGPADRTQGSMVRGLNQQFNWRGADTEVNLTYEGSDERGYLFIESRQLAGRFNDRLPMAHHGTRRGGSPQPVRL
jgi:hypothetical protein